MSPARHRSTKAAVSGSFGPHSSPSRRIDGVTGQDAGSLWRGKLIVTVIVVAAFGPYVIGGARTEQFAVYGLAVFLTVATIPLRRAHIPTSVILLIAIWATYALVAAATPPSASPYDQRSYLAGLDNVLLPLAVMLICVSAVTLVNGQAKPLVDTACLVIPLMMVVNTAATLVQYGGIMSWDGWWSAGGPSTAMFAATNGRFSGLIAQPAEAGTLYGIAALCALRRWARRPGRLTLVLVALALGGILTVSKVFLLVAAPIVLVQLLLLRHRSRLQTIGLIAVGSAALWLVQPTGLASTWAGANQFRRIAPAPGQSLVTSLTASRFGSNSTLEPIVDAVMRWAPAAGFGAAGIRLPYDNGWVEAFVVAGLIGATCYSGALAVCLVSGLRSRQPLLWGSAILATGASLGLPVLTANRVGTVLWLVLTLMLFEVASAKPESRTSAIAEPTIRAAAPVSRRAR